MKGLLWGNFPSRQFVRQSWSSFYPHNFDTFRSRWGHLTVLYKPCMASLQSYLSSIIYMQYDFLHNMIDRLVTNYKMVITSLGRGQRRPFYSCRLREQQKRQHWGWNESQLLKTIVHLTCRVFLPVAIIMKSQYCLSSGTWMTTMSRSCEKI